MRSNGVGLLSGGRDRETAAGTSHALSSNCEFKMAASASLTGSEAQCRNLGRVAKLGYSSSASCLAAVGAASSNKLRGRSRLLARRRQSPIGIKVEIV